MIAEELGSHEIREVVLELLPPLLHLLGVHHRVRLLGEPRQGLLRPLRPQLGEPGLDELTSIDLGVATVGRRASLVVEVTWV